MSIFVRMPLSAVPLEWRAALAECNENFKIRWNELLSDRAQATVLGDTNKVERIDFELSRMMAATARVPSEWRARWAQGVYDACGVAATKAAGREESFRS